MSVREINPQNLREMLDGEKPPLLVDVREPWEADLAQIEGSLLIPMSLLPRRLQEIPAGHPIALYCHHGVRSLYAAEYMSQLGYEVLSLAGGIDAWAREVEKSMARY